MSTKSGYLPFSVKFVLFVTRLNPRLMAAHDRAWVVVRKPGHIYYVVSVEGKKKKKCAPHK